MINNLSDNIQQEIRDLKQQHDDIMNDVNLRRKAHNQTKPPYYSEQFEYESRRLNEELQQQEKIAQVSLYKIAELIRADLTDYMEEIAEDYLEQAKRLRDITLELTSLAYTLKPSSVYQPSELHPSFLRELNVPLHGKFKSWVNQGKATNSGTGIKAIINGKFIQNEAIELSRQLKIDINEFVGTKVLK